MTSLAPPRRPLSEILWATIGAFIGIYAVSLFGQAITQLGRFEHVALVGSFGATAVLVYGIPFADFSQPRNVILGQVLSAMVGVTVAKVLPSGEHASLAAATAVALSILVMHLTRTMHPPGGSTALLAVIGDDHIRQLGYQFVVVPVLTGAVVLIAVALIIHALRKNHAQRYPTYWW